MFDVQLSSRTQKAYGKASVALSRKLDRCFAQLEHDPFDHSNIKRLSGPFAGRFRYRVGNYRVVYSVDVATRIVAVTAIAHRSDVYE